MARIAIIDDDSEVVALIYQFLTHGRHEFLKLIGATQYTVASLVAFQPEVIVAPLYRAPWAIGRPVADYRDDIKGARTLERVCERPEIAAVPLIVLGISTLPEEMPEDYAARVHISEFLLFPEGLQLLNPTISGYVGSAKGTPEEFANLRKRLAESRDVED
jgi:hypothetical protein